MSICSPLVIINLFDGHVIQDATEILHSHTETRLGSTESAIKATGPSARLILKPPPVSHPTMSSTTVSAPKTSKAKTPKAPATKKTVAKTVVKKPTAHPSWKTIISVSRPCYRLARYLIRLRLGMHHCS